jgi:hypothetical protein
MVQTAQTVTHKQMAVVLVDLVETVPLVVVQAVALVVMVGFLLVVAAEVEIL